MSKDNQEVSKTDGPKDHRFESWVVAQRLNADADTGKKLYQEVETVNALTSFAKNAKPNEPGYIDCKPDFATSVYQALSDNAKKHVQLSTKDGIAQLIDVDPIARSLDKEKAVNKEQVARESARYQRASMGLPETASNDEVIARRAELVRQGKLPSDEQVAAEIRGGASAVPGGAEGKTSATLELMKHGLPAYGHEGTDASTMQQVKAAAAEVPAGTPYLNGQPKPLSRSWDSWIREPNGTHDTGPNPNQELIEAMKKAQAERDGAKTDGVKRKDQAQPDSHVQPLTGTIITPETAAQFNIDRRQTDSGTVLHFPNGVKYIYGGAASLLEPPPGGSIEHVKAEGGKSGGEMKVYDSNHHLVAELDSRKNLRVLAQGGEQAVDSQGNIWVQPGRNLKELHRPGTINEKHCEDYGITIGTKENAKVTRFSNGIEYDPARNLAIVPAEYGDIKTSKEYNPDGTVAKSVTRDARGRELYTLDSNGIHVPLADGVVSQSPAGAAKRESVADEQKRKDVVVNGNTVHIDYVKTTVTSTTTKYGGILSFARSN